ncbi:MAG: 2-hydroxychromene-2-carboxylate isomerase [Beijerinckiaceae bacterium]|nr:2-hydroxychromene-2-carboxylate isomerase [Beijerinckiaceae bacterium]
MQAKVDYYFSVSSPWAYIGFATFRDIVRTYALDVSYKPVLLRDVFEQTGGLPLAKRHPARQRYRMLELQRWREYRRLDFKLKPSFSPFDPELIDRTVIAIVEAGLDPAPFLESAHAAIWERELDLADEAVIRSLLDRSGLDAHAMIAAARAPASGALYAANQTSAIEAGVFGAPSYVIDGEIFWGQDRLELLAHRLRTGRATYRPDVT